MLNNCKHFVEVFEMIQYTDGTVVLDKWDLRALHELYLGEKKVIRNEDVEEKKKEITKTLLHRVYFWLKYPRIELDYRRIDYGGENDRE